MLDTALSLGFARSGIDTAGIWMVDPTDDTFISGYGPVITDSTAAEFERVGSVRLPWIGLHELRAKLVDLVPEEKTQP